jgi:serine/threonine protein kinase
MSILELLHHIVNEPAPRLVSRSRKFPDSATTFIESCLNKEPNDRQSPQELLVGIFYDSAMARADASLDFGLDYRFKSDSPGYPGLGKKDGRGREMILSFAIPLHLGRPLRHLYTYPTRSDAFSCHVIHLCICYCRVYQKELYTSIFVSVLVMPILTSSF